MIRLTHILVICVLLPAVLVSAAIEIISRGKNTSQTHTYQGRTSVLAVDGIYDKTNLDNCAMMMYIPTPITSHSYYEEVEWTLRLGERYVVASIVIHNTAVVPEGVLTRDVEVYARDSSTSGLVYILAHTYNYNYLVDLGGSTTLHFNQLIVADTIEISRRNFLVLCEVDVYGTKLDLTSAAEVASLKKPTKQSGTVGTRGPELAVDGDVDSTDLTTCSAAYYNQLDYADTDPFYRYPVSDYFDSNDIFYRFMVAWWRVDMQYLYLVQLIVINFPTVQPERYYTPYVSAYVSLNDSWPTTTNRDRYYDVGVCDNSGKTVSEASGVATMNCSDRFSVMIVGRYVTVVPYSDYDDDDLYYSGSSYGTLLSLCEVTVHGIRQRHISLDDPALSVFKPTSKSTPPDVTFPLTIAAITTGGVALIVSIILIFVVISKRNAAVGSGDSAVRHKPASNAYSSEMQDRQKITISNGNLHVGHAGWPQQRGIYMRSPYGAGYMMDDCRQPHALFPANRRR